MRGTVDPEEGAEAALAELAAAEEDKDAEGDAGEGSAVGSDDPAEAPRPVRRNRPPAGCERPVTAPSPSAEPTGSHARGRRARPVSVVLDACVLYPPTLRDTLLDTAAAGLYRPHWSVTILDELRRSLVSDGPLDEARATQLVAAIDAEFPDASIQGYEARIQEMTNDPDDRHVLAAAVTARARAIVTNNRRHFPPAALKPFRIQAWSPDGLLLRLLRVDANAVRRVLVEQAAAYRHPPRSVDDVVQRLAKHAPRFVERLTVEPYPTTRTDADPRQGPSSG